MNTPDDKTIAPDSAVYQTLLESTRAIPWKIDWKSLTFAYIGPQIESLLGWERDSWKSVEDWASRIHPDDRDEVVNFCVAQSQSGVDHEADYRALAKNGDYVWIRDVVHVVRNGDEVESLVGFMFDISERKKTEAKLIEMQKQLEELSFKDSLTGIANRRMFDTVIEQEWSAARRHQQPLSLVIIDIDHFKQYNDHYGHIRGDDCIKRVASALRESATRAKDFIARIGGEEFVLVLPETDAAAAIKIAERCRSRIFKEQIEHQDSTTSHILTISLGVDTIIPGHDDDVMAFVEKVDQLLYAAKRKGRNRIEHAAGN